MTRKNPQEPGGPDEARKPGTSSRTVPAAPPGTVGVRELKSRVSGLISEVREQQAEYVVTVHGEPAALLRPLAEEDLDRLRRRQGAAALSELDTLAESIAAGWTSPRGAVELLEDERHPRS
jgi:prevent-host-death family protein